VRDKDLHTDLLLGGHLPALIAANATWIKGPFQHFRNIRAGSLFHEATAAHVGL
jgi:hypothetical protein